MTGIFRPATIALTLTILARSMPAAAQQDNRAELASPRWTYEIRVGRFEPDLDGFEIFYGDDNENLYALAGSYRVKDWLEIGGEYADTRAKGSGILTSSQEFGGSVRYQLNAVQIFSNFIFQRDSDQLVVPYVGVGLAVAKYEQEISQQGTSEGRTDTGYSARVGVRFMIAARKRPLSMTGSPWQRSFVFLEAQEMSFDADTIEVASQSASVDLGGRAYSLGFRMEFDFN